MGEFLGGGTLRKSAGEVWKRNLERQTTELRVYAGDSKWVIWPDNPDLTPENIKNYLRGVKVFQPKEVRGLQHTNTLLVFNFDTGVGVEVLFLK